MPVAARAISTNRYQAPITPDLARLLVERLPSDEEIETLLHFMDLPAGQVESEIESVRSFMRAWLESVFGVHS